MAEKGKVKSIKDGSGGIVVDAKTGLEYEFFQKYTRELCISVDDRVKYDQLVVKAGTPAIAINVERITAGTVVSIDASGNGSIEERISKKKVACYQPYATEMGIEAGDVVRYSLILTSTGEMAVNLVEVVE